MITVNGVNLNYVEKGAGEEIIFFIHGWLASSRHWKEVMELLPENYHSYAIDLRGFGQSEKVKEGFTIAQFARDIYAFTQKLGLKKCVFVGHSAGGAIAQQIALDHHEIVKALILVATVPCFGTELPSEILYKLVNLIDMKREELESAILALHSHSLSKKRLEELVDDVLAMSRESFFGMLDAFRFFNQEARMGEIKAPALFIGGSNDLIATPRVIQRAAAGIIDSRIEILEKNGHFPMIENPNRIVELIGSFIEKINRR